MVFDGIHLVILRFQALEPDQVRNEDIRCTAMIFAYYTPTLRLGLMRTIYEQLRRAQYELSPRLPQAVRGYDREWQWYSGRPWWARHDNARQQYAEHPSGFRRAWRWDVGIWYWIIEENGAVFAVPDTISFSNLRKRLVGEVGGDRDA